MFGYMTDLETVSSDFECARMIAAKGMMKGVMKFGDV